MMLSLYIYIQEKGYDCLHLLLITTATTCAFQKLFYLSYKDCILFCMQPMVMFMYCTYISKFELAISYIVIIRYDTFVPIKDGRW